MSLHLMQVPGWLKSAVDTGSAFVDGAVVKDAVSREILAHLQPTTRLAGQLLQQGIGSFTQPLSAISSLVANAQLLDLKRMVEQVQLVATIGASASILNLGATVGGFALVLRSLGKLDVRLTGLAARVESVEMLQKADFLGRCTFALRRADEAFLLSSSSERSRYWQEADERLGELTESSMQLLEMQGLALEGPKAEQLSDADRRRLLIQQPVVDALRWMTALGAARTEVLLCLGNAELAAVTSARTAAALRTLPVDAKLLALAATGGEALPPSLLQSKVLAAKAVCTLIDAGRAACMSRSRLTEALHAAGTDTAQALLDLHGADQSEILVWARDD